tara:strand:- start:361 stop:864 length:504 start_codon:yes stop_codon:yes gene_type:complete
MKITKTQLKQIIKEELERVMGEGVMSLARDIVPGGLTGEDQDLMDRAKRSVKRAKAGQPTAALDDILPGSDERRSDRTGDVPQLSGEGTRKILKNLSDFHIYALILATKLRDEQMDRVVKHHGKGLAAKLLSAVDQIIHANESITMEDFHPNIQLNYRVAQGLDFNT